MDLDKPLDDIIKSNRHIKKQSKQEAQQKRNGLGKGNNNHKPGPIRTRTAIKKATALNAAPYVKAKPVNTRELRTKFKSKSLDPANIIISKAIGDVTGSANNRITSSSTGLGLQTRHGTSSTPMKFNTMIADKMSGVPTQPKAKNVNIRGSAGGKMTQFSIKGESGPATVYISNLDPGVNADDVKTSFMQVGDILTCTLKSTNRLSGASAEIQFARKADALSAINRFNNALADGRVLKVELKPTPNTPSLRPTPPQSSSSGSGKSKLYSDQIVANGQRGYSFRQ